MAEPGYEIQSPLIKNLGILWLPLKKLEISYTSYMSKGAAACRETSVSSYF